MRFSLKFAVSVMAVCLPVACVSARAQGSSSTNDVGRTPTPEEIKAWDIAVGPSGKELPPGSGTAKQGAAIFTAKCVMCHGSDLQGAKPSDPGFIMKGPTLIGGVGKSRTGAYLPFATTIYDFINRAMPRFKEGTLKPEEVYALTALVLYKNDIIKEDFTLNARTLPEVKMPNRNGFLPPRLEDIADLQKRGCKQGQCGELVDGHR